MALDDPKEDWEVCAVCLEELGSGEKKKELLGYSENIICNIWQLLLCGWVFFFFFRVGGFGKFLGFYDFIVFFSRFDYMFGLTKAFKG